MRYFTIQEANAFIPALQSTFGYIERLRLRVVGLVQELQGTTQGFDFDSDEEIPEGLSEPAKAKRTQIAEALREIKRLVRELEVHGLIVKQLDGLVDFRSMRGARPVYLSWRRGEDHVEQWHEVWSSVESSHPVDKFFAKPLPN